MVNVFDPPPELSGKINVAPEMFDLIDAVFRHMARALYR